MVDPDLLARLDQLERSSFSGRAWRHVRPQYPPLSGEGARVVGGRWNPPQSFPTLYLGLSVDVVVAEFHRHLTRQGLRPQDALPRMLYEYEVNLSEVLDLREPAALRSSGLPPDLHRADIQRCQALGDAAHYLGMEGILAPSAAGPGAVLVVFLDRQHPTSTLRVTDATQWEPPADDRPASSTRLTN